jgi:uncharacterized protein
MLKSIKSLVVMGTAVTAVLLGMCGSALASGDSAKSTDPIKVVYHISDIEQAVDGLRNASNHLAADPTVKITFVTHSSGIDFLIDGAKDKNGNPYNINVERLMAKGVTFDVCHVTLTRRKIDPKTLMEGIKIVPSGVAEVARLQAKEGYVYLKP